MKDFFSRVAQSEFSKLPLDKTLFAFDFDGTLAPLVSEPGEAYTLPVLRPLLRRLSRRARVVVISGRAVRDVKPRLFFSTRAVIGNHGLEGVSSFAAKAVRAKKVCRKWVAQLRRSFAELPPDHGLYLEDKSHSLSLHYRHARNPLKVSAWLADEIENLWPTPRVVGGKLIFNIVPKGSPHKGTALKALMKKMNCTHAVFVGDDTTDEDAFGEGPRVFSIRVGRKKGSKARYYVKGLNDMTEVLKVFLRGEN